MENKKILVIFAGVLAMAVYGAYAFSRGPSSSTPAETASTTTTNVVSGLPGIEYGYVGKSSSTPIITATKLPKAPSLDRSITPPSYFLPDTAQMAVKQLTETIKAIKAEPGNAALWGSLGVYRKGIEDYQGAKEALEYSLALDPRNAVVTENLGVVYGDYLKDPVNAEKYYLAAIKLEPEVSYRYLRLYELYTGVMKDDAKAKAIIESGLKANPGDPNLSALLEVSN